MLYEYEIKKTQLLMHFESKVSQFLKHAKKISLFLIKIMLINRRPRVCKKNRNKCSPIKHISLFMNFVNDDEWKKIPKNMKININTMVENL